MISNLYLLACAFSAPALIPTVLYLVAVVIVQDVRRDQTDAQADEQARRADRLQSRLDTYRQVAVEHLDRLVPNADDPLPRRRPQPRKDS